MSNYFWVVFNQPKLYAAQHDLSAIVKFLVIICTMPCTAAWNAIANMGVNRNRLAEVVCYWAEPVHCRRHWTIREYCMPVRRASGLCPWPNIVRHMYRLLAILSPSITFLIISTHHAAKVLIRVFTYWSESKCDKLGKINLVFGKVKVQETLSQHQGYWEKEVSNVERIYVYVLLTMKRHLTG